jgi:hypothetical protein
VLWLSDNSLFEALGSRALFVTSHGGADFGECWQAVQRVGVGAADEWYREWTAVAQPRVELVLHRALNDQSRPELGELRQRLAGFSPTPTARSWLIRASIPADGGVVRLAA